MSASEPPLPQLFSR